MAMMNVSVQPGREDKDDRKRLTESSWSQDPVENLKTRLLQMLSEGRLQCCALSAAVWLRHRRGMLGGWRTMGAMDSR